MIPRLKLLIMLRPLARLKKRLAEDNLVRTTTLVQLLLQRCLFHRHNGWNQSSVTNKDSSSKPRDLQTIDWSALYRRNIADNSEDNFNDKLHQGHRKT